VSSTGGAASPDAASLAVPRYIGDTGSNSSSNGPRPAKSPRHASHQSVASAGISVSNETASGEYRYGPPSAAPGADVSGAANGGGPALPPLHGYAAPPSAGAAGAGGADPAGGPGREYLPPTASQGWGSAAPGDAAGADRPYGYPAGVKAEAHPGAAAAVGSGSATQQGYGFAAWNPA
jgi:hypothetical protein